MAKVELLDNELNEINGGVEVANQHFTRELIKEEMNSEVVSKHHFVRLGESDVKRSEHGVFIRIIAELPILGRLVALKGENK
ncbi:MAG: hypothetical protein Q4E33_03235 [Erysipelotrichaceae bacterium]|nr:hypothetical protein [Erysipelotrichaceae bacterium]